MHDLENTNESFEFEVKPRSPRVPGKKIGLIATGLAVVIAVGILVAVAIGTATSQEDPLARTMPPNAIAYFSMTTHPDMQPHFDAVAAAWRGSKEAEQIESTLNSMLTFSELDWEKDILPWLGDRAALGIVDLGGYEPPPADSSSGESPFGRYRMPFIVLAAQTRDRARSDAFLAAFREQRESSLPDGSAIFDELYRDVSIAYVANDAEYLPPYGEAWATVGDVVVAVTSGRDDLKKVVDAALDGTTLAETENFRVTMDALSAQNVAAFYVDYTRFMGEMMALTSQTYEAFAGITPDATGDAGVWQEQIEEMRRRQDEQRARLQELLQAFGGMGAVMTYEPSGIRFDWAMQHHPDRLPEDMRELYSLKHLLPASNRVFDSIPSSAILAVNMTNLAPKWGALLDSPDWLNLAFGGFAFGGPFGGEVVVADKIDELEQSVGVDLRADLLDLLVGEMALATLPKPDQPDPPSDDPFAFSYGARFPFEFAALLDSTDTVRAAGSLDKLFGALLPMTERGARLQPLDTLPGSAVLASPRSAAERDAGGGVTLAYAVVDGRLVIASTVDTLRAIDAAGESPLSADETFLTAMSALPADRLASGYVRLAPLWDALFASPYTDSCEACNYLRPFEWLSFAGEAPDEASSLQRGTLHIGLEPEE